VLRRVAAVCGVLQVLSCWALSANVFYGGWFVKRDLQDKDAVDAHIYICIY